MSRIAKPTHLCLECWSYLTGAGLVKVDWAGLEGRLRDTLQKHSRTTGLARKYAKPSSTD
ncbi:MAG: hypothetical protein ACE5Z5_11020 [Candidatus Bathyarchaeia archaeon]